MKMQILNILKTVIIKGIGKQKTGIIEFDNKNITSNFGIDRITS